MARLLPWFLSAALALGWYLAVHPEHNPLAGLLARAGAALTPRQALLRQWGSTGFDTTAYGRAWRAAGDSALRAPSPLGLPGAARVYFASATQPTAVAYAITVPAGRIVSVVLSAELTAGAPIVELHTRSSPTDTVPSYLRTLSVGADTLPLDIERTHHLVLRVEAAPLALGNVSIEVATAPALGTFPVRGATERDVGSKWGAPRDGGRRRHEGIDVFEARGTPLVAAAHGTVSRVRDGGLGGKSVWLRLRDAPLSLYYAHLDSQYVAGGERLRPGDTLGTVGNTGNARTTPPHLHFGIYGRGGAVDPLPFVAGSARADLPASLAFILAPGARLARRTGRGAGRLSAKQYARPLALADDHTLVQLADGTTHRLASAPLEAATGPLRRLRARVDTALRASAIATAPAVAAVGRGARLDVLAEGTAGAVLARDADGVVGWY